jgi:putative endonuclease
MTEERIYYVYILANKKNGTLYVGVTNNLVRRVLDHKDKVIKGFTGKYNVDKLMYFEMHKYVNDAIRRESNIKAWKRAWKIRLIEEQNKEWKDLFNELVSEKDIADMREYFKQRNDETGFQPSLE